MRGTARFDIGARRRGHGRAEGLRSFGIIAVVAVHGYVFGRVRRRKVNAYDEAFSGAFARHGRGEQEKRARSAYDSHGGAFPEVANGLFLADTPGFTMLDFARYNFFPSGDLAYLYREFEPYIGKCKYTKCTHLRERARGDRGGEGGENIPRTQGKLHKIYEEMKKTPDWARKNQLR